MGERVGQNKHSFVASNDLNGDVAGGVARRVDGADAAGDIGTGVNRGQLVLDALEVAFGAGREILPILGQARRDVHPAVQKVHSATEIK